MADPAGNSIFWRSVAISLGIHLAAVIWILLFSPVKPEVVYKPLGVMDFMVYDPEGGEPGGGVGDHLEEEPELETAEPESEPAEPEELPAVVESAAEEAEPLPPPPPPKKVEAKPRPKPAAAPRPAAGPIAENTGQIGQGRGGEGGGSGRGTRDAMKAYQSQVRRKLERNKKYPQGAQARNITGVATISFTIHRNGSVSGTRLAKSSGHAILDDEVVALLQRTAPMPAIPPEIPANAISLSVPIRFSVR